MPHTADDVRQAVLDACLLAKTKGWDGDRISRMAAMAADEHVEAILAEMNGISEAEALTTSDAVEHYTALRSRGDITPESLADLLDAMDDLSPVDAAQLRASVGDTRIAPEVSRLLMDHAEGRLKHEPVSEGILAPTGERTRPVSRAYRDPTRWRVELGLMTTLRDAARMQPVLTFNAEAGTSSVWLGNRRICLVESVAGGYVMISSGSNLQWQTLLTPDDFDATRKASYIVRTMAGLPIADTLRQRWRLPVWEEQRTRQEQRHTAAVRLRESRCTAVLPGVLLLGHTSRHGRCYLPECLRQAVPLYDGVPVYAGHTPDDQAGRRTDEPVGEIRSPRYDPDHGIIGDLHYRQSHPMATRLQESAGQPLGLSHQATGKTAPLHDGSRVVQSIGWVYSVDLTDSPASTTTGLVEIQSRQQEDPRLAAWRDLPPRLIAR